MTELRDQFDSPWKEILEVYFEDFKTGYTEFIQVHRLDTGITGGSKAVFSG
jgi:hypothetical protein